MKNILIITAIAVTYSLSPALTNATVGGPTLIDSIQYSSANKSQIIYEELSYSGKGCPPGITLMNLQTSARTKLASCNDADWMNSTSYNAKLENILASYPSLLKHIDLGKNNISAQITITGRKSATEQNYFLESTDFRLDVFQNGEKKASYTYSGCSTSQLHVIEGYIIPNVNTLVLLVSTKGDCFEGGYTRETLYTVPNITLYNQSPLALKNNNEAKPGTGNLSLVATKSDVPPLPGEPQNTYKYLPQNGERVSNTEPTATPITISVDQSTQPNNTLAFEVIIGALIAIILILILRKR